MFRTGSSRASSGWTWVATCSPRLMADSLPATKSLGTGGEARPAACTATSFSTDAEGGLCWPPWQTDIGKLPLQFAAHVAPAQPGAQPHRRQVQNCNEKYQQQG